MLQILLVSLITNTAATQYENIKQLVILKDLNVLDTTEAIDWLAILKQICQKYHKMQWDNL